MSAVWVRAAYRRSCGLSVRDHRSPGRRGSSEEQRALSHAKTFGVLTILESNKVLA